MFSPHELVMAVNNTINYKPRNLFIIHSNLHLLQAIVLSKSSLDVCLYTSAVSEKYLKEHFKGTVYLIEDQVRFSMFDLYPLKSFFKCKNDQWSVFLGNKHNFWSTYVCNALHPTNISILDDGLSSYGISSELYVEKNVLRKLMKNTISKVMSCFGVFYVHESNNSELDRYCDAYYFFPHLLCFSAKVKKIQLDKELFSSSFDLESVPPINSIVQLASYDESIELYKNKKGDIPENIFLHPRVTGKSPDIPTEIAVFNSKDILLGPSSLILFLMFMDYQGNFHFQHKDKMEHIYNFLKGDS